METFATLCMAANAMEERHLYCRRCLQIYIYNSTRLHSIFQNSFRHSNLFLDSLLCAVLGLRGLHNQDTDSGYI